MNALLAYLDPGSGSLLLQLIVVGTAGLAVFGRHLWQSLMQRYVPRRHSVPAQNVSV